MPCKSGPGREHFRREYVYELHDPPRIVIRKSGKAIFLQLNEIVWIEAKGECTRFHIGNQIVSVNQGITLVENRLDPHHFVRIHKSYIVNIAHIKEIGAWFRGDYRVTLCDGIELNCTRLYKLRLDDLLERLSRAVPNFIAPAVTGGLQA